MRRTRKLLNFVWPEPDSRAGADEIQRFPGHFHTSGGSMLAVRQLSQMDIRDLTNLIVAGRNADGGWGYYPQKKSRLEPTCWAVLALASAGDRLEAGDALYQWPARDGLLLERAGGEPNYAFHALALIALHSASVEHKNGNRTLLEGLQRVKGIPYEQSTINRQDNSIQAWSWIDDTFSWVEPTAWCLLALKTCAQAGHPIDSTRIRDGERLLTDRACRGGGWNYGNSNMLGKDLAPYVPNTAIALLAMRDRAGEPAVAQGLEFLERHATSERSAMALALASRALRAHGRDVMAVHAALREQLPITVALGNHATAAAALYALTNGEGPSVF